MVKNIIKKMRKIKLSILDQSVIKPGGNAKGAVNETIATAKLAEQLGYSSSGGSSLIAAKFGMGFSI